MTRHEGATSKLQDKANSGANAGCQLTGLMPGVWHLREAWVYACFFLNPNLVREQAFTAKINAQPRIVGKL